MGKKRIALLLAALLVLTCGCTAAPEETTLQTTAQTLPGTSQTTAPTEETLPMAPDFTVYDQQGNGVQLSDFLGKPVILNFWASWCGPCKSEMPEFQEAFEEYGEDIHFLVVNLTDGTSETVETASAFIADSGYTFPVYYDTASDAANTYGIYSIPTTYFIDAQGHAIAYGVGAMDMNTLLQGISMILPE